MPRPDTHPRRFVRRALALAAATCAVVGGLALWEAHTRAVLVAPPPTLLLDDRHGRFLAELAESDDAPVGFWRTEPTPERVAEALIAIEDRRFWEHPGVDVRAILRALRQNLGEGRRVSGASTIAMQVARMQSPGPRTLPRKVVEALTALLLVHRYGREAVLAHYLTITPYGGRIHGIGYAARKYLEKPATDLSWAEIALLAAIPQSPTRHDPFTPEGRRRAVARGHEILRLLAERAVLTPTELELAHTQLDATWIPTPPARPAAALHFVQRASAALRASPPSDPRVTTSLDLSLQERAIAETSALVASWADSGAENAAVVAVDHTSMEVVAYVGSADYFDRERSGAIDHANVPRAAGSTLKPFLWAFALDRGVITPASVLDDLRRAPGVTTNADHQFLGPLLARVALANSRNVPAVNLLHEAGPHAVYALLADLGLHDRSLPYEHYGAGLAIGLLPVTLSDLVEGYGALARDGRVTPLAWSTTARAPMRRVFSEDAARQLTLFLSDPIARLPTFPRMGATEYPYPVALKTGTSEGYRDAWTVAYSRRWLVGAWVGRSDARPMRQLGGAASAAKLVHAMMDVLHARDGDGLADLSFPPPAGTTAHRLCERTGLVATDACEHTFVEWLPKGDAPIEPCTAHVALPIDVRTGAIATHDTPSDRRETRTFTSLAPRYASWAAARGLVPPPSPLRGRPALRGDPVPQDSVALSLVQPVDGARVTRDPEAPRHLSTLALEALAGPSVSQLVFFVDGRPFATVSRPFQARWPLEPGAHTIEVRAPYGGARSRPIRVVVE
ncbi:transglycosylase domain-containing protein [Myxococcota bacterium]|nr:transglycosylase domain-containing protein [Myxococcota bacterium]